MNIDRIVFGYAGYGFDCVARAADMNLRGGDTYIQETKNRICQKGFQAARAKQGNNGRLMWRMLNERHDGLCWKFSEKVRNLPSYYQSNCMLILRERQPGWRSRARGNVNQVRTARALNRIPAMHVGPLHHSR